MKDNQSEKLNTVISWFSTVIQIRLGYFERQNQWLSQAQLIQEVVGHYRSQVIRQLYVLVLGLDVIGNPLGLVVGLTKGVEDLFYEPFQVSVTAVQV